ncbi:histidine kinase [Niabella yanshanensis]|uniref:Histidine kinase n=1 Tax=Niabella yanshanensis TaxID=577386 RepID=A0ABZ0W744_9BACT|nr:histidine kinase [Niabella yanshanensis]WQD38769.1 histidine kinase [Niabella yanshanensis]
MNLPLRKEKIAGREISLFIFILLVMSILYGTPRLFSHGITAAFLKEIFIDCIIMTMACLPVWWLHFRKWAQLKMQLRFMLHLLTAPLYYILWILLYMVYNQMAGLPRMTGTQILQNSGPNLLFYIQVFSSLHIDLFFREREAQFQKQRELQDLAHGAEINALKAQIQPHFLFNTLNSISASVPPTEEHARVLIAKLAGIFRYGLDSIKQELVPLEKELEFIANYLSLEKERFGHRLRYEIDITPDIAHALIPPMLLQPLVENAIRHGIEPSVVGGTISINCSLENKRLVIEIQSSGAPCMKTIQQMFTGAGLGLPNTAKRLKNQFNETLLVATEGNDVKVQFSLPCSFNSQHSLIRNAAAIHPFY